MHFTGNIYRPPQEANTPLLQITAGCSHNSCAFCSMHKEVPFRVSPMEELEEDLKELRGQNPYYRSIYFTGGDPFVLSTKQLREIIDKVREYLPMVEKVSMYARVSNIASKTLEELKELRKMGLYHLYMGPESGDDETLKRMNKEQTAEEVIKECKKLDEAGIGYSVSYLNGLAGPERGEIHAIKTAEMYNQLNPALVGAMSLTLFEDTELYEDLKEGNFKESSELERAVELKTFLEHLEIETMILGHPTGSVSFYGRFPEDKEEILRKLQWEIDHFDEEFYRRKRENTSTL